MNKLERILISIGVILIIFFAFFRLLVLVLMQESPELGVENGLFQPCTAELVCVSSQIPPSNTEHSTEKIPNFMPVEASVGTMKMVMKTMTGAILVEENGKYLHYEVHVQPFGFVDDVEFYFPCDQCFIEVRSSARIQYPDFNNNARRLEMIRERFTEY